jgi:hypothetical protein
MGRKFVVFASLQFSQQLLDRPPHFGKYTNECLSRNQTELTAIFQPEFTWL